MAEPKPVPVVIYLPGKRLRLPRGLQLIPQGVQPIPQGTVADTAPADPFRDELAGCRVLLSTRRG